jgi:hypothetical protein
LLEDAGTSRIEGTTSGSPSYVRMSFATSAARRDSSERTRNPLKLACATAILHHGPCFRERDSPAMCSQVVGHASPQSALPGSSGLSTSILARNNWRGCSIDFLYLCDKQRRPLQRKLRFRVAVMVYPRYYRVNWKRIPQASEHDTTPCHGRTFLTTVTLREEL